MTEIIGKRLIGLAISIFIAFMVMRHFQSRRYPHSEKYLTFWPRFWSPSIDNLVLWPFTVLIPLILAATVFRENEAVMGLALFTAVIQFAYTIHFNAQYGGTVGKLQCNLRIRDHRSEGPISYRQAILRDLVPIVLLVVLFLHWDRVPQKGEEVAPEVSYIYLIFFLWFAAEILTMLTNSKRRALHDFIAGTVVVRTNIADDDDLPSDVIQSV